MPFSRPERIDELVWQRLMVCNRTARLVARLDRLPFPHVTLAQAAEIACMEPTAFSRFFHHRIGVKFSEFLRAYRVSRALREMEERDAPLKEIAGRAGFRSLATFDRAVKKETGASPSQVRHALSR